MVNVNKQEVRMEESQEMGDKPLVDENGFEYVIDFYSYFELLYKRFENQITEGKVGTKWL